MKKDYSFDDSTILGTFGEFEPPKGKLTKPKKASSSSVTASPTSSDGFHQVDGLDLLEIELAAAMVAEQEARKELVDKWYSPAKSVGKKCYQSHKPLPIKVGENLYYVRGGSCCQLPPPETEVFVGFDHGMSKTERRYPWTEGHEVYYPIQDMSVPADPKNFKSMIVWLSAMILEGKKVYMGCIGGHGRTGLVMAALVTHMTGEKDSIAYVRKHYCKKAVESKDQVAWLGKHFGIKPQKGAKEFTGMKTYNKSHTGYSRPKTFPRETKPKATLRLVACVPVDTCIHGDNEILSCKKPGI